MKLAKLNSHIRDKEITFDEEPHIYYIKGDAYTTSVTKFIHNFFGKFEPKKIVEKYYERWQMNENSKYFGLKPEEIIEMWESNGKLQSDFGTKLHLSIEEFYNDLEPKNDSKEFNYFLDFNKEHQNLKPYRTEWMVYCEELKLAGSIDMVYEDEENDCIHIYDWKRSKEIKEQNRFGQGKYPISHLPDANFWHYSLQLNCYKYILEKYYDKKVEDMYLIVLHPTNDSYLKLKVKNMTKEVEAIFKLRLENLDK